MFPWNFILFLYWNPKLFKCPYRQRYIAGSVKHPTKHLSKLLTSILLGIKIGLQCYCDTSFSRGGVYQMWILKNSKDLLENIQSWSLFSCNSIKTFDFSNIYTTKKRISPTVIHIKMAKVDTSNCFITTKFLGFHLYNSCFQLFHVSCFNHWFVIKMWHINIHSHNKTI